MDRVLRVSVQYVEDLFLCNVPDLTLFSLACLCEIDVVCSGDQQFAIWTETYGLDVCFESCLARGFGPWAVGMLPGPDA